MADISKFIEKVDEYLNDPKPVHLMSLGTMIAGYVLYQNYITVLKEKRRRRILSEMSTRHGKNNGNDLKLTQPSGSKAVAVSPETKKNILTVFFGMCFSSFNCSRSLDQILSKVWIPSIERGLAITKNRNNRCIHSVWHYSEFFDTYKRGRPNLSKTVLANPDFPENLKFLMKISKVFGPSTFEDILRLNDCVEYIKVPQGTNLFSVHEADDKIYIVLTGILQLNFQGDDGEYHMIKKLRSGDQIISLLSFIDFVMGKKGVYRTIQSMALIDSEVMKIPMSGFRDILMSDPVSLARGLQRTLRRAYEVIFTACHQILGLTKELIKEHPRLPVPSLDDIPVLVKPSHEICRQSAVKLMSKLFSGSHSQYTTEQFQEYLKMFTESSVITVPKGFSLFEPGHTERRSVVFVYEGELEVSLKTSGYTSRSEKEVAFFINANEIFGSLVFLTNDARQFSVRTSTKSIIVYMPEETLTVILRRHPLVIIPLIESIFNRLSPFSRQMDFGIEWTYVESGQALFYTNEDPVATYLVLNGRLRSYITKVYGQGHLDPGARLVGQYGKYDVVGLVEMWTNRKRTKTVLAVRDTELAKIPHDFITAICRRHAKVAFQILQYLTLRMVNSYKTSMDISSMLNVEDSFESTTGNTFALFPAGDDVPISYIAKEFATQYKSFGKIGLLSSNIVRNRLGQDIFITGNFESSLTAWLCALEAKYTHLLYIADSTPTEWSVKCFHQADIIFIVVNEDGNKEISAIEQMILDGNSLAKKELLICHRYQGTGVLKMPRRTRLWLEKRPWLDFHHHVYCENIFYNMTAKYIIDQLPFENRARNPDIGRIVRWIAGNTFGFALGGGGARGAAHIGFLREFCKIKLPIDLICGVSIGSFIGALFAVYQGFFY